MLLLNPMITNFELAHSSEISRPAINRGKEHISNEIMNVLLKHVNLLTGLELSVEAWFHHYEKIHLAVSADKRIRLVIPAFPAKSPNPEKTFGCLPDYAEILGLERLQNICNEIKKIYEPGAQVVVCSDGRVFSDLVQVSDTEVSVYKKSILQIIDEFDLKDLATFDLDDVCRSMDFNEMRRFLVKNHGRSTDEIRLDIKKGGDALPMFNGIHRFVFEDRLVLDSSKSRNKIREESKLIALQVIQRSNAWSKVVEEVFTDAVRLSIHPQSTTSKKLGVRLVACRNIWGTPWHNVAYKDSRGFHLVKRKQAESLDAQLVYYKGKYPYFLQKGLQ